MRIDIILEEVLKEISPSSQKDKELMSRVNTLIDKVNKNLKNAKAILGGSGDKGTWLSNAKDADIFVLFDAKHKDKPISDILEKHLKKSFPKISRLHGSRDYFQIRLKDFTYEIIPILRIKNASEAANITDVSPLHARWVKKHKKYSGQIRLTKQFCRASKVYGAESYIQGFSGYICEILTIYYRSFLNLVRNAAKWPDKVVIDIERYHKNPLFELNKSKTVSPLVVIDPVQADRNAAAAISHEKFDRFREYCRKFLAKPSKSFFIEKNLDIGKLRKKKNIVILEIISKQGKRDIIGARLLKCFQYLKNKLEGNDFQVIESDWEFDNKQSAFFYFVFKSKLLSEKVKWKGPPLRAKRHADAFKRKYKKTFVEDGFICAYIRRRYRKPEDLAKDIAKEEYFKEKTKKVRFVA